VFALTHAFGYAPVDSARTGLPYLFATPDLECVDDVGSAYYNQVVDRRSVESDWNSHEEMRRRDILYRRGVVVGHNQGPASPGDGSCIFLHVWRGPLSTTSGCTAMPESALVDVIRWLDAEAVPVLVQLPSSQYRRLERSWDLPSLP
jgi:D-alanyl-D-alanine dipeptidase